MLSLVQWFPGKALDFAPAGRRHELRCNPAKQGKVELLEAPGATLGSKVTLAVEIVVVYLLEHVTEM